MTVKANTVRAVTARAGRIAFYAAEIPCSGGVCPFGARGAFDRFFPIGKSSFGAGEAFRTSFF